MKPILKKWLRIVCGSLLLVLGVAGLFLPFLQGLLFLAMGAMLLAPEVPLFRNGLKKLRKKYPRFDATLIKTRKFFRMDK